jgi:LmbE family N-acetylglucosaminyl deacetylase
MEGEGFEQPGGKMNVIAIGAHPDDIEYGCGGTVMKHIKSGDKVHFIILSRGEKSGNADVRAGEALRSAKTMGATLHQFDYPDTQIPQNHEVIDRIEKIIHEVNPRRIYTHSVKDTHQDHRNVAYATLAAARNVPEIFFYESPSLYLDFNANYYVDISGFVDRKLDALNTFVTQNGKDYMKIEAIRGLAQFRGLATFVKYAEAFETFRILKKDDF